MKGPLLLGEGQQRHTWEQTKLEKNTYTNPTDTDEDIGRDWRAKEDLEGEDGLGKPCNSKDGEGNGDAFGVE